MDDQIRQSGGESHTILVFRYVQGEPKIKVSFYFRTSKTFFSFLKKKQVGVISTDLLHSLPFNPPFFWVTTRLFERLVQNVLQLPVRTPEFVGSPFLDRFHHLGIESQDKVFGILTHDFNGSKFLH